MTRPKGAYFIMRRQKGARGPARAALRNAAAPAALWLLLIASTHVAPSQQSRDRNFPAVPTPHASHHVIDSSQRGHNYNLPLQPTGPGQHHRSRLSKMNPSRLLNKLKPHGRRSDDMDEQSHIHSAMAQMEPNGYLNQPKHGRIASFGSRFRSKIDDVSKRIVHPRSQHSGQKHDLQGLFQTPNQAASRTLGNNQQAIRDVSNLNLFNGQQRGSQVQMQPVDIHEDDQRAKGQPRRTLEKDNDLRRRAKHEGNRNNPVFKLQARPAPSIMRDDSEDKLNESKPSSHQMIAPPPSIPKAATQPSIVIPPRAIYTPTESSLAFKREHTGNIINPAPPSSSTPPPTNGGRVNPTTTEAVIEIPPEEVGRVEATAAPIERESAKPEAVDDHTEQAENEATQTIPTTLESLIEINESPENVDLTESIENVSSTPVVTNTMSEASEAHVENQKIEPTHADNSQMYLDASQNTASTEQPETEALTTMANIDHDVTSPPHPPPPPPPQVVPEEARDFVATTQGPQTETHVTEATQAPLAFQRPIPTDERPASTPLDSTTHSDVATSAPSPNIGAEITSSGGDEIITGLVEPVDQVKPDEDEINRADEGPSQLDSETTRANPAPATTMSPMTPTEINRLPNSGSSDQASNENHAANTEAKTPEASEVSDENHKIESSTVDDSKMAHDTQREDDADEQTEADRTEAPTTMANIDKEVISPLPQPPAPSVVPEEEAHEIDAGTQQPDLETHPSHRATQPPIASQGSLPETDPNLRSSETSPLSSAHTTTHSEVAHPAPPSDIGAGMSSIDRGEELDELVVPSEQVRQDQNQNQDDSDQTSEGLSQPESGTTISTPAPALTIAPIQTTEINRLPDSVDSDQASIENDASNKEADTTEAGETQNLEMTPMSEQPVVPTSAPAVEQISATTIETNHIADELVKPEPTVAPIEGHRADADESTEIDSNSAIDENLPHLELAKKEEAQSQIEEASQQSTTQTPETLEESSPASKPSDQVDDLQPSSQEDKSELEESVTSAYVPATTEFPADVPGEEHTTQQAQAQLVRPTNDLSKESKQPGPEENSQKEEEEEEGEDELATDKSIASSDKLESPIVSNNISAEHQQIDAIAATTISPDQLPPPNDELKNEDATTTMNSMNDESVTTGPEAIAPPKAELGHSEKRLEGNDETLGTENMALGPARGESSPPVVETTTKHSLPASGEEQKNVVDDNDKEMTREENQQQSPLSSPAEPNELEASEHVANVPTISEAPPMSESTSELSRAIDATELSPIESLSSDAGNDEGNSESTNDQPAKVDGEMQHEESQGYPESSTTSSTSAPNSPEATTARPIDEIEKPLVTDSPLEAPSLPPSASEDRGFTSGPKQSADDDSTPTDVESPPEPKTQSELPIKPDQQVDGTTEQSEPDAPFPTTFSPSRERSPTLDRRVEPDGADDEVEKGDSTIKVDIPSATTELPDDQTVEQEAQTDSDPSLNDHNTSSKSEVELQEHRDMVELDEANSVASTQSKSSSTTDDETTETQIDSVIGHERKSDNMQQLKQVEPPEHAHTATYAGSNPSLPITAEVTTMKTDEIDREIGEHGETTGDTTTISSEPEATHDASDVPENPPTSTTLESESQAPTTEEPSEEDEPTVVERKAPNEGNYGRAGAENDSSNSAPHVAEPPQEPHAELQKGITPDEEQDKPLDSSTGSQDQRSNSELDNGHDEDSSTEAPLLIVPTSSVTTMLPEGDDNTPEGGLLDEEDSSTEAESNQQQEIRQNSLDDDDDEPQTDRTHDRELHTTGKDNDDDDQEENQSKYEDLQSESNKKEDEAEEHDDGGDEEEPDIVDVDQPISDDVVTRAEIDDNEPGGMVRASVPRLTAKKALADDKDQPLKHPKKHKKKSKSKSRAKSSHRDFMRQPKRRRIFYR